MHRIDQFWRLLAERVIFTEQLLVATGSPAAPLFASMLSLMAAAWLDDDPARWKRIMDFVKSEIEQLPGASPFEEFVNTTLPDDWVGPIPEE